MKIYFNKIGHLMRFILFILVMINLNAVFAQKDIYTTANAQLIIKAHLDDKTVEISSKNLVIMLDYETGKIEMRQEISALSVNNDSLQSQFKNSKNEYIRFVGKLQLDYINTKGHPPLNYGVEGTFNPGNKQVIGEGRLVHIAQGSSYACLLSLSFVLQADDIFSDYQPSGTNNEIHIQIMQSLLARENE